MDQVSSTYPAFEEAQKDLAPYIKTRQEVAHIRRVLALHLQSQVYGKNGDAKLLAPLSLACESATTLPTTSGSHGLRKEYLKALKANIKARQDYSKLTNQSRSTEAEKVEEISLSPYLALEKQKQKLERLRILQKYFDSLAIKTPTFASFLEQPAASIDALPPLPVEAVSSSTARSGLESPTVDLDSLVQELERDVLRAKLLLKSEKELLAKVRAEKKTPQRRKSSPKTAKPDQIIKALEKTRNELISWIEEELGKAGDTSDTQPENPPDERGSEAHIEQAVKKVRENYAYYLQARKQLLKSLGRPTIPDLASETETNETIERPRQTRERGEMAGFSTSYLSELLAISREQKSLSQQRSYLTTSLAKQNKETLQVFDRLADESHLLPKYQLPLQTSIKATGGGSLDELNMAIKEKPGASHRAKEWTYAAQASSIDTMEAVCMHVDEGKAAIEEARKALDNLDSMLGYSVQTSRKRDKSGGDIWMQEAESEENIQQKNTTNIWSTLDGQLGVL